MKKITLKDIAAESGFSFSLVSKVLRQSNIENIPEETQEHIRKCASRLKYVANKNARSLKTGNSDTIAVVNTVGYNYGATIYPIITESIVAANAFDNTVRDIIFFNTLGGYKEYENLQRIMAMNPDAIIYLVPPKSKLGLTVDSERQKILTNYATNKKPLMFLMEHYNIDDSCTYAFDEIAGSRAGTEYLLQNGRKNIYFFRSSFDLRTEGYVRAMMEAGIDMTHLVSDRVCNFSHEDGYHAFMDLYASNSPNNMPDAIFATCDVFAMGVCKAMQKCGVTHDDIALMGFDGLDISSLAGYSFHTVRQPVKKIASEAYYAVQEWLKSGNRPQSKLFLPEIIKIN